MSERQIDRLLAIMRRLRDPATGCPWDRVQTFASLAPYTLEEACEVVDVLERGDVASLRDELGDLLFQIVFLAQLAEETAGFDFEAVAGAISDKLVRRHPHVFAGGDAGGDLNHNWEALKADERQARGLGAVLSDVPLSLPALSRAAKLGRRAARVGFDWPDAAGARDKVHEELQEFDAAVHSGDEAQMREEMGDLLLAMTSWARHLRLDPEASLRQANAKFEMRFARMEALAGERGVALKQLDPAGWDELWNLAKAAKTP
ncbi:MAG TPA: nucleoside triphosphate pyrophosphohydrolase [Steroidobacteraceae bacterium]|jgi:MazG family protein|nr:nucleoside triphosphate pyrophosphohydrolase [Steroidobacteraceae bacterium]